MIISYDFHMKTTLSLALKYIKNWGTQMQLVSTPVKISRCIFFCINHEFIFDHFIYAFKMK